jgi:D-lactate dehydrogenase (cytochrome)
MTYDCAFLHDLSLSEDQISTGESDLDNHAGDWGTPKSEQVRPDAVVWPESTADVSAVLAAADERGVPVTPYAAGTGLEANATPVERGISLDLTRMNDVLEVRPKSFQIDVEPGAYGSAVTAAVADEGLFFPPLPSSGDISTIGGMIATDASGMQTVKYGEVADWVLGLEAVLADGTVITTGSRAVKTSSGYNLGDLLIGSEGTLAVVTRATLELAGRPEQIRGGRALFETLTDAGNAVRDAVQSGVDVAKIELIDADSARMANAYSGTDLPDRPTVFVEFHANHGVTEEVSFCESVFESHGVTHFEMAEGDEMDDLWQARKDLAFAVRSWDPELTPLHPGDVTVPIDAYPEILAEAKELATEQDILLPCFGHAGDGNLHYSALVDEDDPDELERAAELHAAVVERAIELGGTATGEHGIGTGKRKFLELEHGEAGVATMRRIKDALDPNGTLNPGKVFPDADGGGRGDRLSPSSE